MNDAFFVQPNPPWLIDCATDCIFYAVVTDDLRINQTQPPNLIGDISNHLIFYDCNTGTWVDVGTFLSIPGPTGGAGPTGPGGPTGPQAALPTCVPSTFSAYGAMVVNPGGPPNTGRVEQWVPDVDTDFTFNPASGQYVIPKNGNYAFHAQVTLSSALLALTVTPTLSLRVNGGVVSFESPGPVTLNLISSFKTSLDTEFEMPMKTGDVVDMILTDITGAPLTGFTLDTSSGGAGNQFYGFQIGGCQGPTGATGPSFTPIQSSPIPFIFGKGFYRTMGYTMSGDTSPTLAQYSAFTVPTAAPTTISGNTIWGTKIAVPPGATKAIVRAECSMAATSTTKEQIYIGIGENNIASQQLTLIPFPSGVDYTDRPGGSPHLELTLSTGFFDLWVTGSNDLPSTPDVNMNVTFT